MRQIFKVGLRLKIAFAFLFLVITMMITVTYIFTIRELDLRVEQVKLRMERLANNIATIRSVETEDWSVYQTYIDNQLKLNADIVYIAIFDEESQLKVYALNLDWIDIGDRTDLNPIEEMNIVRQLEQRQLAEESQKDLESKAVNIKVSDRYLGTVKVGFSLVELNNEMSENLHRNLTLAIIFFSLAIVIAFVFSYKIVTPLKKLTRAMLNVSHGDLKQKIAIRSRDEIGEMAATFNFMTNGLQQKEFIENFNRELSYIIEFNKISDLVTTRITQALNARNGFLFLIDKNQPEQAILQSRYPDSSRAQLTLSCNEKQQQQFIHQRKPFEISMLNDDLNFGKQLAEINELHDCVLIAPIVIKEELIGLFILGRLINGDDYSEVEKNFLGTLINQGNFAIESALLYEELTTQERLKHELKIARRVQQRLLPLKEPQIVGLDIAGICLPTDEVGGDYYDYFILNEHTVGIAIADVTGKGTSAAFYMAVVKGIMLSLAPIILSPTKLLIEVNKRLYGQTDKKVFTTMTYAIFDVEKKKLTFARAGHNALIVRKFNDSQTTCFEPSGLGLGLEKGDIFNRTIEELQLPFQHGDSFLFFTDGISEAMNSQKDEYGETRLHQILKEKGNSSANVIRDAILHDVREFVGSAPQHDDIAMVVVTVR